MQKKESVMASKAVRYFSSKKFRQDMKKVGSDTVPFGNSTPTEIVLQRIEKARLEKLAKRPQSKAKDHE
jgi:hypothetical protein